MLYLLVLGFLGQPERGNFSGWCWRIFRLWKIWSIIHFKEKKRFWKKETKSKRFEYWRKLGASHGLPLIFGDMQSRHRKYWSLLTSCTNCHSVHRNKICSGWVIKKLDHLKSDNDTWVRYNDSLWDEISILNITVSTCMEIDGDSQTSIWEGLLGVSSEPLAFA